MRWVRAFLGDSCGTVRARQKAPRRRPWTLWDGPRSTRPPSAVTVPLDPDAQPAVRLGRPLAGLATGVTGRGGAPGVALGSRGGASASWRVYASCHHGLFPCAHQLMYHVGQFACPRQLSEGVARQASPLRCQWTSLNGILFTDRIYTV